MSSGRIPAVEGGIQPTIFDAKADILTATAADTPARLAVGANDTVLTADSSTATGLKWATPTVGGKPSYIATGKSYYAQLAIGATSNVAPQYQVTSLTPIYLPTCTLDRISVFADANFAGGATDIRLGIYNNGSSNIPTTVLLDAGTVSASAVSTAYEITINQSITEGLYWLAFNMQTNNASARFYGNSINTVSLLTPYRSTVAATPATAAGFDQTGVAGAFGTITSVSISTVSPRVYVRVV